jgi:cell division protein ZapD
LAHVVLFEFPLNETVRTMLRLENLFDRLGQLLPRDPALDHHFALTTTFEILDIATRSDLKGDLLRELEHQRQRMLALAGRSDVSSTAVEITRGRIEDALAKLTPLPTRLNASFAANDWLASVRSRVGIPGGTCEFDLPAFHAWQRLPALQRRNDLLRWIEPLMPLAQTINVLLGLLRESGVPQLVAATAGQYQQSLPSGRSYQLLRVRVPDAQQHVPEVSGSRLMVSLRLVRPDEEGRLRATQDDVSLEITLCQ